MRLRRLVGVLLGLACWLGPWCATAQAINNGMIGFTVLTYVCPGPFQINFSWTPVTGAVFYALQLVGPLDPTSNGGVTGTYVRQFAAIEVANGAMNSASVTLSQGSLTGVTAQQWQVMIGGPNGYTAFVPRQQVALVPIPCTQTTPQQSPYF